MALLFHRCCARKKEGRGGLIYDIASQFTQRPLHFIYRRAAKGQFQAGLEEKGEKKTFFLFEWREISIISSINIPPDRVLRLSFFSSLSLVYVTSNVSTCAQWPRQHYLSLPNTTSDTKGEE